METLFNSVFRTIDIATIYTELQTSSAGDILPETHTVEEIEASQERQIEAISTAISYAENIKKYSENEISLSINQLKNHESDIIIKGDIFVLRSEDSSNILGVIKRGDITPSYSRFLWMFEDLVMLDNKDYSLLSLPIGSDIIASSGMIDYYFLGKQSGQTIYSCTVNPLPDNILFLTVDLSRILSLFDARRYFLPIDTAINITGKTIYNNYSTIISTMRIKGNVITIDSSTKLSKILSETGTTRLKDVSSLFLTYMNREVSSKAVVSNDAETNTMPIIAVSNYLSINKAPFKGWETIGLKKIDEKSSLFKNNFVSILLSGNSIPEEEIVDFRSVCTKKELMDILDILEVEIANMDVCNDN